MFIKKPEVPFRQMTFERIPGSASSNLLSSLKNLGSGRIISRAGSLSLAVTADFKMMDSSGRFMKFQGGELEIVPAEHELVVSTAACGLGLGISVFDLKGNLQVVFHFCHGSSWRSWIKDQESSGLLQELKSEIPSPENLCWCDLWPDTRSNYSKTPSLIASERAAMLKSKPTVETRLIRQYFALTTVIHPVSFDRMADSVRFWDRPRSRVCYADLSSLEPQINDSYVGLHS